MIDDKERIYNRLRFFNWEHTQNSYEDKLVELDREINQSVLNIGEIVKGDIHLAYSGGIDSTLLLYRFVYHGFSVVAHTMVGSKENADFVYSRSVVAHFGKTVRHIVHVTSSDYASARECNTLLSRTDTDPDNYFLLLRNIQKHTDSVVCGDCIDEMLGGYYLHQTEGGGIFERMIDRLIPEHLDPLDLCSTHFCVRVFLPYATDGVIEACQKFEKADLVDEKNRKRPIYDLAKRDGVLNSVLLRRKRGLVSALDTFAP